ncbi:unnamed protein product [Lupinus luteus]|uniref:Formin-like protein 18 n=1 Tax=Lupinus luteus TaxID=3873 RepID=A0AAV1YEJ3_LUPLU
MDPCPFVRLMVESLALKLPLPTKPSPSNSGGVHPSTTPCFCKIKTSINSFPSQTALVSSSDKLDTTTSAPGFLLDSAALRRLSGKPLTLRISIYSGSTTRMCGFTEAKLIGRVTVNVQHTASSWLRCSTFQKGWLHIGKEKKKKIGDVQGDKMIHVMVRSEPDPRFVFQFGGEPECDPVVFQIRDNNIRQPVFSCKFSADRNSRYRPHPSHFTNNSYKRIRLFSRVRERQGRERKGWMIIVHDLSGSPVAAASMVTPFVPSPGSDRVSRSNPGAWLILRPNGASVSSWKPWGRLEAWRERGPVDSLGYKFELVTETNNNGIPIAESKISVKKGGQFCIDYQVMKDSGLGSRLPGKGFVMGSSVEGEGEVSKPVVQVGAHHVACMADAALFIALSAAIDLSMDACQLFSRKLRKELCHQEQFPYS